MYVDLAESSREEVMDRHPFTYRVASEELAREGKIRPYGRVIGTNIGDPRSYLYFDLKIGNRESRLAILIKLEGERQWRASHLGFADNAVERSGWVRIAIELPPPAAEARVERVSFECLAERNTAGAGMCRVERIGGAFRLDQAHVPGARLRIESQPVDIPVGSIVRVW
jgi:hypothetical protein